MLKKILVFSVPVVLAGTLQLLYNASDMIVVGRFAEAGSLAAVGATSALINLIVNVFMGLSVGTCVVVARCYGQRDYESASRAAHTSIVISIVCGIFVGFLGFFLARPLLELMATPEDVIDRAALYMKIYFIGIPGNMLYNFGSAIMRAGGDTRRPLYYLTASGIVNVLLNLLFVIVFHMGVAGVATATIISQLISAVLVTIHLCKTEGACKIEYKKLKISRYELLLIAKIGLPAGIQGSVFSISNVIIQSSVNSFGSVVMDGNTAAGNLEGFIYTAMNSVSQAALSFVSQNYGAVKFDRIKKVTAICSVIVVVIGVVMGGLFYGFSDTLLGFYNNNPDVIAAGKIRMSIICTTYFTCGVMDVLSGSMRGLGKSTTSMIVSLIGACLFRIVWIYTVFAAEHTLFWLYISYPISWVLTDLAHFTCFTVSLKKEERKAALATAALERHQKARDSHGVNMK